PGSRGLITANGGYLTKHSFGVWSTEPPPGAFRWEQPQAEVDALPSTAPVEHHEGSVTVEAYTVMHGRDGARDNAVVACRTPEGGRVWGLSQDDDLMVAMEHEELVGAPAHMHADAVVSVA
ncbi:MAG: hypothetical protein WD225_06810, partial [Ilumatobacteraceae bacterium]